MTPAVAHAKSYPFPIPGTSYILGSNGCQEIIEAQPLPNLDGLTGVLASGSNQSPEQLARKFDNLEAHPIPVLQVWIKDFDAVHSPHFSAYGSIPSTLHYHPGVTAKLFTTWLNDAQLAHMHETEVATENYDYVLLEDITVDVIGGARHSSIYAYISRRGALCHNGKPLGLQAVRAKGRNWPEVSQNQVQALARDRLSPGMDLDAFISENLDNADTRRVRTRHLAQDALPFTYPNLSQIA